MCKPGNCVTGLVVILPRSFTAQTARTCDLPPTPHRLVVSLTWNFPVTRFHWPFRPTFTFFRTECLTCSEGTAPGLWIVWWSSCLNRVRLMAEASKRFGCGRWNYWMGGRCRTTVQFLSCRWFDPSVCCVGLATNQTSCRIRLRSYRRYRCL